MTERPRVTYPLNRRLALLATCFCTRATLLASMRVAAVVGTALNLLNQWHGLFGPLPVSVPHLALNYLVPFLVSGYSTARRDVAARERSP
jgi:hypothetical protein